MVILRGHLQHPEPLPAPLMMVIPPHPLASFLLPGCSQVNLRHLTSGREHRALCPRAALLPCLSWKFPHWACLTNSHPLLPSLPLQSLSPDILFPWLPCQALLKPQWSRESNRHRPPCPPSSPLVKHPRRFFLSFQSLKALFLLGRLSPLEPPPQGVSSDPSSSSSLPPGPALPAAH